MATAIYQIGELARRTGCAVETIRYYERIGVLPAPTRSASGYRRYGDDHLKRLLFVRRCRDLGFSLEAIARQLALADKKDLSCCEVDAMAQLQLTEVRRKIADLQALERELAGIIAQCAGGTIADCRILEALFEREGTTAG